MSVFVGAIMCVYTHTHIYIYIYIYMYIRIQYTGVPGEKVNIQGDHSIGYSKQKCLYEYVSYSKRFPR